MLAAFLGLSGCVVGSPEPVEVQGAPAIQSSCSEPCDRPDPPRCLADRITLRSYSGGGCVDGVCRYEQNDITCREGCHEGRCVEDPCAGVVCDEPPPPECVDDKTRRRFGEDGWCEAGRCHYPSSEAACAQGCEDGACIDDPCVGVTCDRPPVAYCADDRTLRTYDAGSCSQGECRYEPSDQVCEFGCDADLGACNQDCTRWDLAENRWCGAGQLNCDCTAGCGVHDVCQTYDPSIDCRTWDFSRSDFCPAGIFNCDCTGGCGSASCD